MHGSKFIDILSWLANINDLSSLSVRYLKWMGSKSWHGILHNKQDNSDGNNSTGHYQ